MSNSKRRWIGQREMSKPIGGAEMQDRLMAVPPLRDGWRPPLLLGQVANDSDQCHSFSFEVVADLFHGPTLISESDPNVERAASELEALANMVGDAD